MIENGYIIAETPITREGVSASLPDLFALEPYKMYSLPREERYALLSTIAYLTIGTNAAMDEKVYAQFNEIIHFLDVVAIASVSQHIQELTDLGIFSYQDIDENGNIDVDKLLKRCAASGHTVVINQEDIQILRNYLADQTVEPIQFVEKGEGKSLSTSPFTEDIQPPEDFSFAYEYPEGFDRFIFRLSEQYTGDVNKDGITYRYRNGKIRARIRTIRSVDAEGKETVLEFTLPLVKSDDENESILKRTLSSLRHGLKGLLDK